jgi:hypothetical protein
MTIANALRVAAEQYGRDPEDAGVTSRVSDEFRCQQSEAAYLAARIEQASRIILEDGR